MCVSPVIPRWKTQPLQTRGILYPISIKSTKKTRALLEQGGLFFYTPAFAGQKATNTEEGHSSSHNTSTLIRLLVFPPWNTTEFV